MHYVYHRICFDVLLTRYCLVRVLTMTRAGLWHALPNLKMRHGHEKRGREYLLIFVFIFFLHAAENKFSDKKH